MIKNQTTSFIAIFILMTLLIPAASADTCSFCEFINISNITRGVTDHWFLTNRSAEDAHPQYILTAGTRAFTGKQSLGGFNLTDLLDPVSAQDAATKNYVDTVNTSMQAYVDSKSPITDHGLLSNLSGDGHPQYILVSGTRAFTGKQSMGGFNLTDLLDPVALQDAATKNYVDLVNASQTAYTNAAISLANTSMKNYVDATNASMKSYVDTKAVSDHGLLSNLSGDGHPQYILVSGTRAFTGKQSLGGFNLTDLLDPVALQDAATKNYVDLVNASQTAYTNAAISLANTSMKNYVDAANASMKSYVDTKAVSDHGLLSNLTGDGHPQYLLVNGSRAMTGNLSVGSHYIVDLLSPSIATDAATKGYVDSVNTSMKNYVDTTNASMKTYVDNSNTSMKSYVDTANSTMKNYVDTANTSMKNYVDNANTTMNANTSAAIIAANTSLKNYVDTRDAKIGVARLDTSIFTTSTTATNMTGLSFYLGAGQTIQFDGYINNNNSGTNGNKYAIYIPAGATLVCHWEGDGTSILLRTMSRSIANGTLTTQNYHTYISQDGYTTIHGTIKNGANAGTVTLMYAAVTSGNVTINAGSYLEWKKLDSATAY
jgi:hypothetical protein